MKFTLFTKLLVFFDNPKNVFYIYHIFSVIKINPFLPYLLLDLVFLWLKIFLPFLPNTFERIFDIFLLNLPWLKKILKSESWHSTYSKDLPYLLESIIHLIVEYFIYFDLIYFRKLKTYIYHIWEFFQIYQYYMKTSIT